MPSVSSHLLYLSHSHSRPIFRGFFFCDVVIAVFFQRSTLKYQNQNRLSLWARKSSILWNSVAAGGGRNQVSSQRFLIFLRVEIALTLFTMVLLPFISPVAEYPTPTPIPHLFTASCTCPTFKDACAEKMASPAHESDSSSGTTAKIAATAAAGV